MEPTMDAATRALVLDLVEWVATRPRSYGEVMEAWRSSCPRHTIWEDARDQGLLACENREGVGTLVLVTPVGRDLLKKEGRLPDALTTADR